MGLSKGYRLDDSATYEHDYVLGYDSRYCEFRCPHTRSVREERSFEYIRHTTPASRYLEQAYQHRKREHCSGVFIRLKYHGPEC